MLFVHILQMLIVWNLSIFKLFRNVEFHTLFGAGKILETPPSLNPGCAPVWGWRPLQTKHTKLVIIIIVILKQTTNSYLSGYLTCIIYVATH